METKKLSSVLHTFELLVKHRSKGIPSVDLSNKKFIAGAHAELAELQRLVSVVNGFIEGHSITSRSDVDNVPNDWASEFMKTLCSIVGYKE